MVRAADQRASDADREAVVELLRAAAGEGRIGPDELDERLARALNAKTYRELNATIEDLPRNRDRNRGRSRTPQVQRSVATWALRTVRADPWLAVFVIPVVAITAAAALAAMTLWLVFMVAVLALGRHHRGRPAVRVAGYARRPRPSRSDGR